MVGRRFAKNSKLIVASFAIVVAMIAAISFDFLDRLSSGWSIDKTAVIGFLSVYSVLFFIIAWLVPIAIRRHGEAALCVVSIAAALILIEMGCRIFVPGATAVRFDFGGIRSRQLHHIYAAQSRMYMGRFDGKDVFVDTNEDGLRTAYSKKDFKKYQSRVIVLGDSFTLGLGVTSEDSFPKRLEDNLRRAIGGESIAVLNAGIVSYSPFLEKLLFERKLTEYRPTLVALILDATDIGDDYLYMKESAQSDEVSTFALEDGTPPKYRGALYELTRPYHRPLWSSLKYPLQLARKWVGRGKSNVSPGAYDYYESKIAVGDTLERNRFFIYRHPLDETRYFFDRTIRNVDEIAGLATQMGAGFALFVTPRFHHWNANECPDNWEKNEYRLNETYQYEYFRYFDESQRAYPIINMLPDFQATDEYPLVFRQDPHWNAAGHAFVADTVTRHMLKRRLIYSTSSSLPPSQ